MKSTNKKSQVVIYDFLAGFVIFSVIIIVTVALWFRLSAQMDYDLEAESKLRVARDISFVLTKTEGIPHDWHIDPTAQCVDNDCTLGLAVDNNVITDIKLKAFVAIASETDGYARMKELLNCETYDFHIQFKDIYGNILNEVGQQPLENLSSNIKRYIIINNTEATIDVTIY